MGKKRKIRIWMFTLVFLTGLGTVAYKNFPAIASKYFEYTSFSKAQLKIKKIKVKDDLFTYAEKGTGKTLLFIHGFQGDKKTWLNYIKPFSDSHHIVMLDLPAHGGSTCCVDQKFDLLSLAETVNDFVETKEMNRFCLIGTSMGAGISMQYAALYPDRVEKMVLINPIGIKPHSEKEYLKMVAQNEKFFFPDTVKQLDDLYLYLNGFSLSYNNTFKKYILDFFLEKKDLYKRAFKELVSGDGVESILPQINAPTLLLMGEKDKVARAIDFKIYSEKLPKCLSKLIPNGYHILHKKALEQALEEMQKFINN